MTAITRPRVGSPPTEPAIGAASDWSIAVLANAQNDPVLAVATRSIAGVPRRSRGAGRDRCRQAQNDGRYSQSARSIAGVRSRPGASTERTPAADRITVPTASEAIPYPAIVSWKRTFGGPDPWLAELANAATDPRQRSGAAGAERFGTGRVERDLVSVRRELSVPRMWVYRERRSLRPRVKHPPFLMLTRASATTSHSAGVGVTGTRPHFSSLEPRLAKVRVAGSNPVVRSLRVSCPGRWPFAQH